MSSDRFIFVGFERTAQVDSLLEVCEERDRAYLNDPEYLESIRTEGCSFIGKRIKDGAAMDRIEDTARSVVSLLTRINHNWSLKANSATIIALEDSEQSNDPSFLNEDNLDDDFDYSELVD